MKLKLKLVALTIACASIMALPASASANCKQDNQKNYYYVDSNNDDSVYCNQFGQDFWNFDDDSTDNTFFNCSKLDPNSYKINGRLIMINMNNTTGSAVCVSFDNTTGSAVNVSFDGTTTAAAVNVGDFEDFINEYNKEQERLNAWIKNMNDAINNQFDEMEKQQRRIWKYFF